MVPRFQLPDEMALLADNAAEVGLALAGSPVVERTTVEVAGGRSLSALVWGLGNPEVVAIHGSAQNAHTWDTVSLAVGRPLVAIDLPGHGHSDWRADHDYSVTNLAADLVVAVDALAPAAKLIVGMSLGGLSALALARLRPDLVRSLMLVDITPGVNREKAKAVVEFISGPARFASYEEMVERTVAHHPERSTASLRRGVLHNARELDDGTWTWRWDPVRRDGTARTGTPSAALWDALGELTVALTVVRGALSPMIDDDDVAEVLRRRPDATVAVVAGAGHSIQGDRPLALAAIITGMLGSPA